MKKFLILSAVMLSTTPAVAKIVTVKWDLCCIVLGHLEFTANILTGNILSVNTSRSSLWLNTPTSLPVLNTSNYASADNKVPTDGFGDSFDTAVNSFNFYNVEPALSSISGLYNLQFTVKSLDPTGSRPFGAVLTDQVNSVGAIPEPASWTMMIVGFSLVGSATRRCYRPRTVTA